jgi:hypothetical protein
MPYGKLPAPVGHVYRLRVEPQWGQRGSRTEYEFFFPEKLDRKDTNSFLDAQNMGSFHHSWEKIHFGARNRTVTAH